MLPKSLKTKKEAWAKKGIDVENEFAPLYIIPSEKKEQVRRLRAALKGADRLYLATDEDREEKVFHGIFWKSSNQKYQYIVLFFMKSHKKAIRSALKMFDRSMVTWYVLKRPAVSLIVCMDMMYLPIVEKNCISKS